MAVRGPVRVRIWVQVRTTAVGLDGGGLPGGAACPRGGLALGRCSRGLHTGCQRTQNGPVGGGPASRHTPRGARTAVRLAWAQQCSPGGLEHRRPLAVRTPGDLSLSSARAGGAAWAPRQPGEQGEEVFISLVGSRGLGCRWVAGAPGLPLVASWPLSLLPFSHCCC